METAIAANGGVERIGTAQFYSIQIADVMLSPSRLPAELRGKSKGGTIESGSPARIAR